MESNQHPIGGLMETTMSKIREMVDVNTIIGDQIHTPDGVTIIPVSKVTFGFTSGGSEFHGKHLKDGDKMPFGGGAGAGVNIIPIAFLVVRGDSVRVLNVQAPEQNIVGQVLDAAPDVIDKVADFIHDHKKKKEEKKDEPQDGENADA
ncbi:MAG: GerW family sporulation protein [Oscillospiraceae bacterium]|jgi:sporulation protein YtfJ|nr:GerW family sporulation protein [Oscillospiraceae bacterium]